MSSIVDENRVNELVELSLKQFPNVDKYLIWVCAVDYVMKEEMKLNIDDEDIKLKWMKYIVQKTRINMFLKILL